MFTDFVCDLKASFEFEERRNGYETICDILPEGSAFGFVQEMSQ